ncbi:pyridoxamine 5'-phosphate oxidase family protein [Planobispora siamensis]|uniref:pyridoxamine 5'-phosphate oxidase family protein n=1 Tax=Planobispora siamensis TaxID=936338 RepID=UPI001950ED33|nr:pyridoxamine 5'-phosphate oxidase family protein [Planobispora siamensis]
MARTGTLAVPVWYRRAADDISVITSLGSRKGRAISESGRFGLVVSTGYRYVSLEGPVVETRECDFARDLVPMAARYLGGDGGRYAALWRDAVGDDLRVFVMRPEHRYSADVTGEFAALGIRPLPLP